MKLRFIVFVLLFSLVLLYTNYSYAYTWDDFIAYCQKITSNEITTNNQVKTGAQYILNNKTNIENNASSNLSRFDSFVCGYNNTYYYFVAANSMNIVVSSSNVQSSGYTTPNWSCQVNSNGISNVFNNKTPINQIYYNALYTKADYSWGLVTGTINNYNRGFYNLYDPFVPPSFTPSYNGMINVYFNGNLEGQANRLPFGYVYPQDVTLGYLTNYNDIYYINGYFSRVVYSSGDNWISENKGSFNSYNNGNDVQNGGLRFEPNSRSYKYVS